jgi:2-methylisocitrate lyase-like PEP mutase family enzyme
MSEQAKKNPSEKAEALRKLHHQPEVLVLPNAWDCASARIFEEAGFPAIATTSAGVAFSLGYPDGQRIPRDEMLACVKRIASRVRVPVTADLEAGYDDIAKTAIGLIESGAVGLNLEDLEDANSRTLVELSRQVQKIKAVRRVGEERGVRIVINARTDQYLTQIGEAAKRFDRACDRLRAYIDAGADCVFVPGINDEETIGRFVEALKFPLNILVGAGSPSVSRLRELGVRRVSVGSGITRTAMGATRRAAEQLQRTGTYSAMVDGAIPYAEANGLFATELSNRR